MALANVENRQDPAPSRKKGDNAKKSVEENINVDELSTRSHYEYSTTATSTRSPDYGPRKPKETKDVQEEEEEKIAIPSEIVCDLTSLQPSWSFGSETEEHDQGTKQQEEDTNDASPLVAVLMAKEWKAAFRIVDNLPQQASEWQYGIEMNCCEPDEAKLWKRLPIHQACALGAPAGLLEAIFQAHPPGVSSEDPYTGALPLHLACRYKAPRSVVETLLKISPRGAKACDKQGRLPLHMACIVGARLSVLQSLLKAHPHSINEVDAKHKTPLDYARSSGRLKEKAAIFLENIGTLLKHDSEKQPAPVESCLGVIEEEDDSEGSSLSEEGLSSSESSQEASLNGEGCSSSVSYQESSSSPSSSVSYQESSSPSSSVSYQESSSSPYSFEC